MSTTPHDVPSPTSFVLQTRANCGAISICRHAVQVILLYARSIRVSVCNVVVRCGMQAGRYHILYVVYVLLFSLLFFEVAPAARGGEKQAFQTRNMLLKMTDQ